MRQQRAQREQIRLWRRRLPANDLGRERRERAAHFVLARGGAREAGRCERGQPEVRHTHTAVVADQDVGRAQIPVDDPRGVDGAEPRSDLPRDERRQRRRQRASGGDESAEGLPFDPLGDEGVLARTEHADDVWVRHARGQADLVGKPRPPLGVGAGAQRLEQHDLARGLVQRFVDDGDGPARDLGEGSDSRRGGGGGDSYGGGDGQT